RPGVARGGRARAGRALRRDPPGQGSRGRDQRRGARRAGPPRIALPHEGGLGRPGRGRRRRAPRAGRLALGRGAGRGVPGGRRGRAGGGQAGGEHAGKRRAGGDRHCHCRGAAGRGLGGERSGQESGARRPPRVDATREADVRTSAAWAPRERTARLRLRRARSSRRSARSGHPSGLPTRWRASSSPSSSDGTPSLPTHLPLQTGFGYFVGSGAPTGLHGGKLGLRSTWGRWNLVCSLMTDNAGSRMAAGSPCPGPVRVISLSLSRARWGLRPLSPATTRTHEPPDQRKTVVRWFVGSGCGGGLGDGVPRQERYQKRGGASPRKAISVSALAVPAAQALDASLLQRQHVVALGALGVVAPGHDERRADLVVAHEVLLGLGVALDARRGRGGLLEGGRHAVEARLDALVQVAGDLAPEGLREAVGHRVDLLAVVVGDLGRADAVELLDDLLGRDAAAQAKAREARDGLGEGGRVAAAAADLREDLEEAVLVLVDGHVERAVAGLDLLRGARDDVGARAGLEDHGARGRGALDLLARGGALGGLGRAVQRGLPGGLALQLLRLAQVEHLVLPAAVAVDGDALAARVVGQEVGLLHVGLGGVLGEVDGLADRGVHVLLEGRLHLHVPLGADVHGGGEDLLPLGGDLGEAARAAVVLQHVVHEALVPEALALGDRLEVVQDVGQVRAVHDVLVPDERELGLAAAARVRDHADGARGRDGRDVGVAPRLVARLLIARALPEAVGAARLGELLGRLDPLVLDELHDLAGHVQALVRVVGDLELEEHAREAHDAQADAARALAHLLDLRERVVVHVD